ncbi:hypothetical protein OBBRIDRAFT_763453, partial [Obba rivulosa]
MRGLIVASLAAAGLAAAFVSPGATHQVSRRKTLGFGPVLPHAEYRTGPFDVAGSFLDVKEDPFEVARRFVDHRAPESTYYIRDDSYTDKATGVSHVYFRQHMYGTEVADANFNVNVKDGIIISYGDSFFRGAPPAIPTLFGESTSVDVHAAHCEALLEEMDSRIDAYEESLALESESSQVTLGKRDVLGHISDLFEWNCAHVDTPYKLAETAGFVTDSPDDVRNVARAVLQFMVAATPRESLAQDIQARPLAYLDEIEIVSEAHLHGQRTSIGVTLNNVPGAVAPVKADLALVQVPNEDGEMTLELVWKFDVEMEDNWYEAAVTFAAPHRIISVVDWASDSPMPAPAVAPVPKEPVHPVATYNVFPWGVNDPEVGNRSIMKENYDVLASPLGWHTLPYANDPQSRGAKNSGKIRNTTTTFGNNVFAHENWEGRSAWLNNYRPDGGADLVFDFKYAPKATERDDALDEAKKYINVSITQLFYTSNLVHDLYYRYGFDEVSGNFQQHNFGRGGKENDAVIANAQDGSGYNNANFMTPPDGQNGRCRMYLWNTANPYRDGDLEAGIVIHELSHGLSTRLTGGPANSGCLGWGEAGGMGEGWGDFLATTIRSTKVYSDYPMGAWAANRANGIRNYPYSLNETVNPSTYKTLDKPGYWGVHAIGEVWAEILWVVSQRLIAKHGFVDSLFPPPPLVNGTVPAGEFYRPQEFTAEGAAKPLVPRHGNSLGVQLVLNGMKLQPCNPSFFDARDAIIAADEVLTGGENYCELWAGFAARGLGPDARVDGRTPWGGGVRTNGFDVPRVCKGADVPDVPDTPDDGDDDDDDDDWLW